MATQTTTRSGKTAGMRELAARFPGTCDECGQRFPEGTQILWRYGYTLHVACAPQPTADDLAAEAAREAEEAQRQAAAAAAAVEARKVAKANKAAAQAAALEAPLVRYAKGYDNRNSALCSRCGGTGQMPFSVYSGLCFKCNGDGREFVAVLAQPRVKVTAENADTARVGDVLRHGGTLYRVTGFTWIRTKFVPMAPSYNQRVHMVRLADGDTNLTVLREVHEVEGALTGRIVETSDAMRRQPAEVGDDGRWLVY